MTWRNWCRFCGECNVLPYIEPDIEEIIQLVVSVDKYLL